MVVFHHVRVGILISPVAHVGVVTNM